VLRQQGHAEEAIEALREAIRLNPDAPGAFNTLGQLLRAKGDAEGSKAAFAEGARIEKLIESGKKVMLDRAGPAAAARVP
jgi:tetratricopeptide (TPR) repeat protein